MRILQIIEPAHRATLEEQDDTVLWFTRALRAAGAAADVLLVGTATSYAARGQHCPALRFGRWQQSHPPAIEHEILQMIANGARVLALREDLAERGIEPQSMIPGIGVTPRAEIAALFGEYQRVWKW
jgi:hypothetical protein